MMNDVITVSLETRPVYDEALIASVMRHPRVFPHISDDSLPGPESLKVALNESLLFLGIYEGDDFHGLFLAHPHNAVCWEVHTCLLPSAWGARANAATQSCARWLWDNTLCERIITAVPDGNTLALNLARRAGMVVYGVNPRSIQRGGKLLGLTMLGMNKEQPCLQQQQQ